MNIAYPTIKNCSALLKEVMTCGAEISQYMLLRIQKNEYLQANSIPIVQS